MGFFPLHLPYLTYFPIIPMRFYDDPPAEPATEAEKTDAPAEETPEGGSDA